MTNFTPTIGSVPAQPTQPIPYKLVPMDRGLIPQIAALELESMNSTCIVAVTDDRTVLGYAGITVVLDEGYINNIAVARKYRRMGLGSDLLGVFLRFAEAQNLSFLTLEVRDTNLAARALYHKFGFEEVGRRKNYYDKPTEDAILMTKFFRKEGNAQ